MLLLLQTPGCIRFGTVGFHHLLAFNHKRSPISTSQAEKRGRKIPKSLTEKKGPVCYSDFVPISHNSYQECLAQPAVSFLCCRTKCKDWLSKVKVKWYNSGAVVLQKYKEAVWATVLVFDVTQRKNCEKH